MEGSSSSKEWKLPPPLLLALMLRLSPRGLSRPHQSYLSRFWSHAGRLRRYDNGRVGVSPPPFVRSANLLAPSGEGSSSSSPPFQVE